MDQKQINSLVEKVMTLFDKEELKVLTLNVRKPFPGRKGLAMRIIFDKKPEETKPKAKDSDKN